MGFEDFLDDIVAFINEARGEQRNDLLQQIAEKVMVYHTIAKKTEGEPFHSLKTALGNDLELYCLVLSTVYYITEDVLYLQEIEGLYFNPDLDLFVACNIWFQVANIRFRNLSLKQSYIHSRQINSFLLERYEKEYPLQVSYLPYQERNKKRIVIETDTLLSGQHAPSRIVLEICRTLIRDLGYEVFLLVNRADMSLEWMNRFWLFPYLANYRKDIHGVFSMQYEDVMIRGCHLTWNADAMGEMQQLMQALYEWKPLCVWHIGGASFRHDYYRRLTTVLSMPCTDGYSVSEAPVLVSYMQSGSSAVQEAVAYAECQGQKITNIKITVEHKEQGKNFCKEDFGIPDDAFVICMVGNRLNDEISEEFEKMLEEAAGKSDRIYFVFIGKCKEKFLGNLEKERVKYLGFREDLVDVIKVTDLFVNPPRQGGGGGAVRAFSVGVPVITLPYCDVANAVGDEFCCEDLSKMKELVCQYETDKDFYESQQKKAKEKYAERLSVNNAENYRVMLQQVEEWLQKGEIS